MPRVSVPLGVGPAKRSRMLPEFDAISTILAFFAVVTAGIAGLLVLPIGMTTDTVLMMVLPSMVVFGAIMLAIGIAHGKHRARP